jgi:hypothetical protein
MFMAWELAIFKVKVTLAVTTKKIQYVNRKRRLNDYQTTING